MAETQVPVQKAQEVIFTEKEALVMKSALLCVKSGMPDIDIQRLTKVAGFNTEKTASNTWAVVKKKVLALEERMSLGEEFCFLEKTGGKACVGCTITMLKTDLVVGGGEYSPKKRSNKTSHDDQDESEAATNPKKKTRKTPAKTKTTAVVYDSNDLKQDVPQTIAQAVEQAVEQAVQEHATQEQAVQESIEPYSEQDIDGVPMVINWEHNASSS